MPELVAWGNSPEMESRVVLIGTKEQDIHFVVSVDVGFIKHKIDPHCYIIMIF